MQPLLADRVGLKPRITEGYERATGLIAALSRARDEKDFREWPSHIGRHARLQARDPFRYRLEGAALAPLLEGVAENAALCRFRPVPGYGARPFQRACAVKRMAEVVSGILPREDRATAMPVLSLPGKPSMSRSGPAVSRLIRNVSGLRRYRPGRFVREAAMTKAGSWAGMWRCMSPHVFALVMARSGRLVSALRPMAPSMPTHKDHEKDVGAEASPRSWLEEKADAATGACSSADAPKGGGGPKGLRPDPERRARP